jgi:hypothetical protein
MERSASRILNFILNSAIAPRRESAYERDKTGRLSSRHRDPLVRPLPDDHSDRDTNRDMLYIPSIYFHSSTGHTARRLELSALHVPLVHSQQRPQLHNPHTGPRALQGPPMKRTTHNKYMLRFDDAYERAGHDWLRSAACSSCLGIVMSEAILNRFRLRAKNNTRDTNPFVT